MMKCRIRRCISKTTKNRRCRNCIAKSDSKYCWVHRENQEEKMESKKNTLFLLAMNRVSASDIARVVELEKFYNVITVSESSVLTQGDHIDTFFKNDRTIHPILDRIEKCHNAGQHITIILDYFWLQDGYYTYRYGMNWLKSGGKVAQMLDAGADIIILPRDGGSKRELDHMLIDTRLNYEEIVLKDNPLWVGTENETVRNSLISQNRGDNSMHVSRYIDSKKPFIRFTR